VIGEGDVSMVPSVICFIATREAGLSFCLNWVSKLVSKTCWAIQFHVSHSISSPQFGDLLYQPMSASNFLIFNLKK
jgi:hypothetical protein